MTFQEALDVIYALEVIYADEGIYDNGTFHEAIRYINNNKLGVLK